MSPSQIIVLATPVFLALIAVEYAIGLKRRRNTYRLDDAISSIGLGIDSLEHFREALRVTRHE